MSPGLLRELRAFQRGQALVGGEQSETAVVYQRWYRNLLSLFLEIQFFESPLPPLTEDF